MQNKGEDTDERKAAIERERLWQEAQRGELEIRRLVLALVEHPEASDEFKSHRIIQEMIK